MDSIRFLFSVDAAAQRMVAPATAATAVWLGSEAAYAKEASPKVVDLDKVRASVMDIIDNDEEKRGDGSECRSACVSIPYLYSCEGRLILNFGSKFCFCTLF